MNALQLLDRMSETNLTVKQATVLMRLTCGPLTISEIAKRTGMKIPASKTIIKNLKVKKLIIRKSIAGYSSTQKGTMLISKILKP
jgi:DNA-binding MarR family transcriptional regulator